MSSNTGEAHIESLIQTVFKEGRCGDFYIVEIEVSGGNQIAVFVDGDEGLSLEHCKQISRTIESVLDEEPTLGGKYNLEISSPGVSRPLKFLRQYPKHMGRLLAVNLMDGTSQEGVLSECMANGILLEQPPVEKKGAPQFREIPFDEIKETFVKVQFGKTEKAKRVKKTKKPKKKK